MPEPAMRKFTIMRLDRGPFRLEARRFKDFMEKTKCRSRTETIRALRKGESFYIGEEGQGYHEKADTLERINVALEAFRNMTNSGNNEFCFLHILTHDNTQLSMDSFPLGAKNKKGEKVENSEVRSEFARDLTRLVAEGTILIVSGNKAHAES